MLQYDILEIKIFIYTLHIYQYHVGPTGIGAKMSLIWFTKFESSLHAGEDKVRLHSNSHCHWFLKPSLMLYPVHEISTIHIFHHKIQTVLKHINMVCKYSDAKICASRMVLIHSDPNTHIHVFHCHIYYTVTLKHIPVHISIAKYGDPETHIYSITKCYWPWSIYVFHHQIH